MTTLISSSPCSSPHKKDVFKVRGRVSPISEVVRSVIGSLEKKTKLTREDILGFWRQAVGERAAHHSSPVSLRRKVLTVRVDGSAWLYELSQKKREIFKSLRKNLGRGSIKEVKFKTGELD